MGGATLSFTDGTPRTVTADGSGNYSFTVPYGWSGTVTPAKTGYTFTPANKTYTNVQANQTAQNYTAIGSPHSISGNAGVAGVTLSYMDGAGKVVTTDASGNYSLIVSYNWSGTVTPTKTGYTFIPTSKTYTNVQANQIAQNYIAAGITYSISGNAGVEGATLGYTDGVAETATSASDGSYSLTVSHNWTGTVTPTHACYTFSPPSLSYTNVTVDQAAQNYTHILDPGSGCADVDVTIAGVLRGSSGIPSGGRVTPQYGVLNGPVDVNSTNTSSIFASEQVHGSRGFINEMMGFPNSQLTTDYWFPWYDNLSMTSWVLIGNPSTSSSARK